MDSPASTAEKVAPCVEERSDPLHRRTGTPPHSHDDDPTRAAHIPMRAVPLLLPLVVSFALGIAVAMSTPDLPSRWWLVATVVAAIGTVGCLVARSPRSALFLLAVATASAGAARLAASLHELPPTHLGRAQWSPEGGTDESGALIELEAIALERPRLSPRRGALADFDHRAPRWRFRAALVQLRGADGAAIDALGDSASPPTSGTIWLSVDGAPVVRAGDHFRATGWLRPPPPPMNPGQPDPRRFAQRNGIVGTMTVDAAALRPIAPAPGAVATFARLRAALRDHADEVLRHALPKSLAEEPRGLVRAMLVGERHEGLDALEPAFRRTGLAHLLAISGFHLAVLAGAAAALARRRQGGSRRVALAIIIGTTPYLLLVDSQPSVLRAGAMLLLAATAAMLGRGWPIAGTMPLALLGILVAWPGDLASPGLQLSFAVVAGLVWLGPRLRLRWSTPPDRDASTFRAYAIDRLRSASSSAIAAWLVSTPLVLHHFGMMSPLAAPLSVVAIPVAAALLVCGHATLVLTPLLGAAIPLLSVPLAALAEGLIWLVRGADALPAAVVFRPSPGPLWTLAALAAVAALGVSPHTVVRPRSAPRRPWCEPLEAVARRLRRWGQRIEPPMRRWGVPLVALLLLAWPLRPVPPLPPEVALRIDALAVGDGTCILLRHGARALLYDVGSTDLAVGGRTILPALRALGVTRLDAIIVSHANIDHYAGLPEVVDGLDVARLTITAESLDLARQRAGPLRMALVAALDRGVPMTIAQADDEWRWGDITLRWLHPPNPLSLPSANDHSQVILVEVAGRTLLLCGDIEDAAVAMLRQRNPELRADIIELPHHGSWRRPATELVVATRPSVIIQSTGPRRLRNDRWTPHLAARLPAGERLITARDGAAWVEISVDGTIDFGSMVTHR